MEMGLSLGDEDSLPVIGAEVEATEEFNTMMGLDPVGVWVLSTKLWPLLRTDCFVLERGRSGGRGW